MNFHNMSARLSETRIFTGYFGTLGTDEGGENIPQFRIVVVDDGTSWPMRAIEEYARNEWGEVVRVEYSHNHLADEMAEYGAARIMKPYASGGYLKRLEEVIESHENMYS